MRRRNVWGMVIASVLILCLLITAGCTSIPGPEPKTTPTPQKTTAPVTPQVKTIAIKTPPPPTTTPNPYSVTQTTPSSTTQGVYEIRTCAGQGGVISEPGETCPGTWLIAQDTFSCCSVTPVTAINRNITVVIEPLDLVIVMDDDPGSILP